jgi:L-iditol 2-dehydrogenase
MRAARLHGIGDMRVEEVHRPDPGPGEVLLKIAAVGVCGSDVHYYVEGQLGDQVPTEPFVLGHEFAAWVEALGPDVEGLKLGELVAVEAGIACGKCEFCLHGHPNLCLDMRFCGAPPIGGVYSEYTVMPAENCFPLPEGFDAIDGVMLEPLGVALHTVDLGHLRPAQTVAVLGAGPIGLVTAAVARLAGATEIYMTEPLAYRRTFAQEYVADAVFNPDETDVVEEILARTYGRGVDVSFDAAAAPETPNQCAAVTRRGGKMIAVGIPSDDRMTFRAEIVRRNALTIKLVRRSKHTYERGIRILEAGAVDLRSLVTHLFPLEQIDEAFDTVAGYEDGVIKAIIQPQ